MPAVELEPHFATSGQASHWSTPDCTRSPASEPRRVRACVRKLPSRDHLLPGGDDSGLLACPASCVLVEARRAARRAPARAVAIPPNAPPPSPLFTQAFCKVNNRQQSCRLLVTTLRIFKMPSALELSSSTRRRRPAVARLLDLPGAPTHVRWRSAGVVDSLVSRAPPVRHGQDLRRRRSASHRRPRGYRGWVALLVRVRASRGWLASRDPRPPPVPPEPWARAPGRPGPVRARADPPRGSERPETPRPAGGAARSRSRRGGGT